MKRNLWLAATALALAAVVGCSTVKTSADYEPSTDFSKYKTWS